MDVDYIVMDSSEEDEGDYEEDEEGRDVPLEGDKLTEDVQDGEDAKICMYFEDDDVMYDDPAICNLVMARQQLLTACLTQGCGSHLPHILCFIQ